MSLAQAIKRLGSSEGILEFQNTRILHYNETGEVLTCVEFPTGIEGAVDCKTAMAVLGGEEDIQVKKKEHQIIFYGENWRCGLPLLDSSCPEFPVPQWKEIPEGFKEALELCRSCCSKLSTRFVLSCVHFHPEYMEGCDNSQAYRVSIGLGDFLLRSSNLKQVGGASHYHVDDQWVMFLEDGRTTAIRKVDAKYSDLGAVFQDREWIPLEFPEEVSQFLKRAISEDMVVSLKDGEILLSSRSEFGWVKSRYPMEYSGKPLSFRASCEAMGWIMKNGGKCSLSQDGCYLSQVAQNQRYVSQTRGDE